MIKNIFIDFDGTILNSQKRIYDLFIELTNNKSITYSRYWEIKRNKLNQHEFLKKYFNYTEAQIADFKLKWLQKIEEESRLDTDVLIPEMKFFLEKQFQNHNLYLVTNRQSTKATIKQVENLGIHKYFKEVLVTEQKTTKEELIMANIEISKEDIFIGDTGEDIITARNLNIKSIAVCWGILNKKILEEYNPDYILEKESEIDKCEILH